MSIDYDFDGARRHFAARLAYTTGPHELSYLLDSKQDVVIVDLRATPDYRAGHIPGAISLPKGRWKDPKGLRKDALNIVYCYSATCHLAPEAALEFASQGYPVLEMEGGFPAWVAQGSPVERTEARAVAS